MKGETFTIWKWTIRVDDRDTVLEMPAGAEILDVQMQGPDLCLWALVHPADAKVRRSFRVHGTGHPIDEAERLVYLGTAQDLRGSPLVWHVFEVIGLRRPS